MTRRQEIAEIRSLLNLELSLACTGRKIKDRPVYHIEYHSDKRRTFERRMIFKVSGRHQDEVRLAVHLAQERLRAKSITGWDKWSGVTYSGPNKVPLYGLVKYVD